MDLEGRHTVDHLCSHLRQGLGDMDVVFLIKTGLQLDGHKDFLAVLRRIVEGVHDLRVLGRPVHGHLDGFHMGVNGGFP